MNNPYFPKRKIRHAKLLTDAGFEIDMAWYKDIDKTPHECNVTKLIYWKLGDIRLIFFDYEQVSVNTLVERILAQKEYVMTKNAMVTFKKGY